MKRAQNFRTFPFVNKSGVTPIPSASQSLQILDKVHARFIIIITPGTIPSFRSGVVFPAVPQVAVSGQRLPRFIGGVEVETAFLLASI